MGNIEQAVLFMENIAADNSHGYAQDRRGGNPDYDCSSLVGTALNKAGFNVNALSTTRTLYDQLKKCGFVELDINAPRLRGDIFLTPGKHVVMCTDSKNIVHASINSKGTASGDAPGDQTGKEICVRSFYNPSYKWTYHLRYNQMDSIGIDVSRYQKKIDWDKVKAAGVNFVILKAMGLNNSVDSTFEYNYKECKDVGLNLHGIYHYSYATSVKDATIEADEIIKLVNGRNVGVIYLDVEDKCQQGIGETLISIIVAYKKVIESNGYEFGLYTGESFYSSYIKKYENKISDIKHRWIARYGLNDATIRNEYKPTCAYTIWQYSSKGKVNGIDENVDLNVMNKTTASLSSPTAQKQSEIPILVMGRVNVSSGTLNVRKEPNTSSQVVVQLNKGAYVQLKGDVGDWYRCDSGYVSKKYIEQVHGIVTANSLNMRSSADSTLKTNIIKTLSKNTEVIICTAANGWYYILDSTGTLGWVSGQYIKLC